MASSKDTRLRNPLATARGLGSAKEGTDHWWKQRMTSIALVPLGLWFIFSVASLSGADYDTVRLWLASPWHATLMILFIFVGFHHAASGLEVIFEDYIHNKTAKLTALITEKFFFTTLAVLCSVAVLQIALKG